MFKQLMSSLIQVALVTISLAFYTNSVGQVYSYHTVFETNLNLSGYPTFNQLSSGQLIVGSHLELHRTSFEGVRDESFSLDSTYSMQEVRSLAEFANGKILIANKKTINPPSSWGTEIIRLNLDGSLDQTFQDSMLFNNPVVDMAITPDGSFYVLLDDFSPDLSERLLHFNYDGILDTSFEFMQPEGFIPSDMEIQTDGKILVGGLFYSALTDSTYEYFNLFRIYSDGILDSTFNPPINGRVSDIEILSDNRVLIGGEFSYNGSPTYFNIVQLEENGALDSSFSCSAESEYVNVIEVDDFGKIWVGGNIFGWEPFEQNRALVRLNSDGTQDTTFDNGVGFRKVWEGNVFPTEIETLVVQEDGSFVATGIFTEVQGVPAVEWAPLAVTGVVNVKQYYLTFSIYPNPTTTNLTIESRTPLTQFWVSDLTGRRMRNEVLATSRKEITIDISDLPPSIYLVGATTEEGLSSVQKVVVE